MHMVQCVSVLPVLSVCLFSVWDKKHLAWFGFYEHHKVMQFKFTGHYQSQNGVCYSAIQLKNVVSWQVGKGFQLSQPEMFQFDAR